MSLMTNNTEMFISSYQGTDDVDKEKGKDGNPTSHDSELPDETVMNNIDLGGILNLATEDTLNIR